MIIYFISGLGADERAFQKLSLPTNWTIKHLKWIDVAPNETLKSYVLKFSKLIDASEEFSLVGLSFGGIMATELNKILQPKTTILISSISTKYELPVLYRLVSFLRLNKLVPTVLLNKAFPFTHWYFGTKTKEEKILLEKIIHDTPPLFLKWAINEILHWKNTERPTNVFHIHGTKDRIFPISNLKIDFKFKEGGHFMVYSKADEISKILIERLG
ncbi:MAG: alpha/beta hydrolase [Cyclobacteriaceae bacterium]